MRTATPKRGFLPETDPVPRLPEAFRAWDAMIAELPSLLAAGRARSVLERLPQADIRELETPGERERALGTLSVFGHAAVHESWRQASATSVPAAIARPWVTLAHSMGRLPVLTYASHGQNNWRRLRPDQPIVLGNIAVLRNFFGGLDENWFVATHVEIEGQAAPLVNAVVAGQRAVETDEPGDLLAALRTIADTLEQIHATLVRVRKNCDPYIFFTRVQPFMQGMKNVVYEGAAEFGGVPQNFAGGSGAQSTLMPLLDAALGIRHAGDALITYLHELRRYMPAEHQAFLAQVEEGPSIRAYLIECDDRQLNEQYNRCIEGVGRFREEHLAISIEYIQKPARQQASMRGEQGTGGSPFVGYLEKHRKETFSNLLP
jgi:indoleamine 2,3-dioxygenase